MRTIEQRRAAQRGTYAAKRRRITLTEKAVLAEGVGYRTPQTAGEIADRLQISVFALQPHLDSLVEKGVLCHEQWLDTEPVYRRSAIRLAAPRSLELAA